MVVKRKVLVYITYQNRLLIFTHPDFPEAGIQVPGGTLRDDESPEAGALREAIEETGLTSLRVVACLGEVQRDMSDFGMDQMHHRYFYHLTCDEAPPETWRHGGNLIRRMAAVSRLSLSLAGQPYRMASRR